MKEKKEKIYLWILVVLAIASSLPLLRLSFYNHPSADDYMYAAETYRVWNETHSLWQVVKAAAETSADFYANWQGLYVSAFVLALQPAIFGEQFYALTGFLMLAILYGGNLFFSEYVFHRYLKCSDRLESMAYGCVLSFVMVQWMPSVVQGLYWFNGAMNYVLFFALLQVFVCLLLQVRREEGHAKNIWNTAIALLVGILLAGGNHITAFMGILTAAAFVAVVFLELAVARRAGHPLSGGMFARLLRSLVPFAGIVSGFLFNVSSPGTRIRKSNFTDTPGVADTIWYSVKEGTKMMDRWMGLAVILSFALLVPFFLRACRRIYARTGFPFAYPLLVPVASVGWCCTMLCPPVYAMGTTGDLRITNVVYFSFVVLLFLNIFYLCGWCVVRLEKRGQEGLCEPKVLPEGWCATAVVLVCGVLLSCGDGMSSYQARVALNSGEAAQYSAEAQIRYETMRSAKGKAVVLEPFQVKPYLLYFEDITEDETDWRNQDMAEYFELESVRLREP